MFLLLVWMNRGGFALVWLGEDKVTKETDAYQMLFYFNYIFVVGFSIIKSNEINGIKPHLLF